MDGEDEAMEKARQRSGLGGPRLKPSYLVGEIYYFASSAESHEGYIVKGNVSESRFTRDRKPCNSTNLHF